MRRGSGRIRRIEPPPDEPPPPRGGGRCCRCCRGSCRRSGLLDGDPFDVGLLDLGRRALEARELRVQQRAIGGLLRPPAASACVGRVLRRRRAPAPPSSARRSALASRRPRPPRRATRRCACRRSPARRDAVDDSVSFDHRAEPRQQAGRHPSPTEKASTMRDVAAAALRASLGDEAGGALGRRVGALLGVGELIGQTCGLGFCGLQVALGDGGRPRALLHARPCRARRPAPASSFTSFSIFAISAFLAASFCFAACTSSQVG